MQKNYPGRLYRFFGIQLGLFSRGFWAIAHRFVDDFSSAYLVSFFSCLEYHVEQWKKKPNKYKSEDYRD
jgi:hypothetical protein